ncbi:putative membrane protein [Synechococcus sp. BOUM118]|nr:putative membrane protein [Synechococcus sp. BOUM118]
MDDNLWAGVVFALGAAVTLATVAMIIQGHLQWRDRGSVHAR